MSYEKLLVKQYKKVDEVPFDFSRKVMSVVVRPTANTRLLLKAHRKRYTEDAPNSSLTAKYWIWTKPN